MERLLAALGQKDRLRIVVRLLSDGPARQVELQAYLADQRGTPVNPGEVSALVKPLLEAGILRRERARGPIEVADREQLARLLTTAHAMAEAISGARDTDIMRDFDRLRRAIIQPLPAAKASE